MREILFRGRTTAGKEWVSGFYAVFSATPFIGAPNPQGTMLWFEVDPATVGQYTGLTDKNGKRIFEGDIVRVTYAVNGREKVIFTGDVKFEDGAFFSYLYGRGQKTKGLLCGFANAVHTEDEGIFCKIIGNIHDNPELLERSE